MSAEAFRREVEDAQVEISKFIAEYNMKNDLEWRRNSDIAEKTKRALE